MKKIIEELLVESKNMDNLKVLLVDDEEELVFTLAERLQMRGINAKAVISALHALRKIEKTEFDVVVMDVKMPGMGGMEAMAKIKEKHPKTEVILTTGHGSAADIEKGIDRGAFDYMIKPVQINDLIQRIQEAAEKKSLNSE